ncbi:MULTISPECIES: hypothetical protein [Streptomycetaceae]|uniref:hypothetical protein n=1 Tax=Streptomycetaceae TaxID=2062 RepID=UPI0004C076EE|nr:hypothetical protein [Streptomyces sp. NRRL S-350]
MNTISPASLVPAASCDHVRKVALIETPLITDLVAAMKHLEAAAARAGSPAEEARACRGQVSEEVFASWITGNAARVRAALNRITAPYEAPAGTVPAP